MNIIEYYNNNKNIPISLNCSSQFKDYKSNNEMHTDITNKFFIINNTTMLSHIPYIGNVKLTFAPPEFENQFSDYKLLNFTHMKLFVDQYFSFSEEVNNCIINLINKYSLTPDTTCAVFYRGNDKCKETVQPSYDDMINKTKETIEKYNLTKIILQTDEREFSETFRKVFPDTIVFTEIPDMPKMMASMQHVIPRDERLLAQQYYIASLAIIAKCKHVVHTSGNGEMWMAFFRNNSDGLHQYLRPCQFYEWNNNSLNPSFDPSKTYFWIDN
jgi:hypothetical protein